MKKVVSVMLAVMMLFSLTACAGGSKEESGEKETDGGDKIRVGFSQMDNNGAWRVVETEDMKAVAEERGYELVYADAQSQTSKQLSDIEDLVAQGVDYLVIAPKETTGLERGLEAAKEAGIPVILIDRSHEGVPGEDYVTYIASDFVYQGYECGQALAEALGGEGKIVVIEGRRAVRCVSAGRIRSGDGRISRYGDHRFSAWGVFQKQGTERYGKLSADLRG